MDALTLDQIHIFLAVVDEGSFSKAAKRLNRAQSAVTYGIQKLEAQIGVPLFDRTSYRATLTEAGHALLLRARRIAEEANAFRDTAKSLTSGLEPELAIVLDSMFPMQPVATALKVFTEIFPTVTPRVYVQPLGTATELLLDGTCAIGLIQLLFADMPILKRFPLLTVDLIPVVAPNHPLAEFDRPIETHDLQRYIQLVLTDRSAATAGRDYGVVSGHTWRLADLSAKHSMLLSSLGWGNMPSHLVEDDLARGRLKTICLADFGTRVTHLAMGAAYRADQQLGPAGRWMVEYLSTVAKP